MVDKLQKELEEDVANELLEESKKEKTEETEKVDTKDSEKEDDKDTSKDKDHDDKDGDDEEDEKVEEAYQDRDQPDTETKDSIEKVLPGKKGAKPNDSPYIKGHDPKAVMPGSEDSNDSGTPYVKGNDATKVVPGAKLAKESVEKMFENAPSLSESFIKKAETVFEAAFNNALQEAVTSVEESISAEYEERLAEEKKELEEKVNEYLEYAVSEWVQENKVELVPSIRSEIAEDFLNDFKALLESHNIMIPDAKLDLYEESQAEIAELKEKVNALTEKAIENDKIIFEHKKADTIDELSEGLAETQRDKLRSLVEDVEANDIETFSEKAKIIRESFFTSKSSDKKIDLKEETVDTTAKSENKASSAYTNYMKQLNSTKF